MAPCPLQYWVQLDANGVLRSSLNLKIRVSGKTILNTLNVTTYSPPCKSEDDLCSAHRPVFSNNRHSKANNNTLIPMELTVCTIRLAILLEHDLYNTQVMPLMPLPWPLHQPKLPQQRSQQDWGTKLQLPRRRLQLKATVVSAMIRCEPYKAK